MGAHGAPRSRADGRLIMEHSSAPGRLLVASQDGESNAVALDDVRKTGKVASPNNPRLDVALRPEG